MREGVLRALPGPPAECAKALAARLAVVAGLAFSLLIQASYQLEAASAAETRFLAWLAALVLLGCELAASVVIAPLVLLVAWVVPLEGPLRAACVGGLLVLAWALSACRRLGRGAPQEPLSRVFWLLLPLALATQALLRGDRLLALAEPLRALGALVVLPVVVALALALLARREGLALAALAGLLSALPAPGWNVAAAMALLGLAAGTVVFDATSPRFLRTLAAAALLASLAWEPRAGLVALLAALALGPGWLGGAAAAAGALLSLVAPARPWDQAFEGWLLLPALVPLLPTAAKPARAVAAAGLALLASRWVDGPAALAAPLALAVLSLPPEGARLAVQQAWALLLGSGALLLAAYPWARSRPAWDALGWLGVEPSLLGVVAVVVVALLVWASLRFRHREDSTAALPRVAVVAALAVLLALPARPAQVFIRRGSVVLDAAQPERAVPLPRLPVAELRLDSYLVNSAGLARGTPVAQVELEDSRGETHRFTLRAGLETAEWAARRSDVATLPGFSAPGPYRVSVAPGGDFLAQFYRAPFRMNEPVQATRLKVARSSELPAAVDVVLFRVELAK